MFKFDNPAQNKNKDQVTFQHIQKAADQGNADAQNSLGDMYYYGEGVAQNYTKALKWLQKAADQGNADAQNSLGDMYYYGEGVTQNHTKALKWLQKAADQGNADAQNSLGDMYYYGEGVAQNYTKALKWLQKAADQGNADAQNSLGDMYYYGEGITKNYTKALKWLQKAADQGNTDAQNSLGDMYYYGEGVTQNHTNNAILTHYNSNKTITSKLPSAPIGTIAKAYGYYASACGSRWESAHSWANETQDCKQCGEMVYPYRQEELKHEDNYNGKSKVPHLQDLCGMCRKLGRSCTLMMSASGNVNYPNDVLIKGLPMDINEFKLKEKFASYGEILKITIPEPNKESNSRIAFITFENREEALHNFNAIAQTNKPGKKLKIY